MITVGTYLEYMDPGSCVSFRTCILFSDAACDMGLLPYQVVGHGHLAFFFAGAEQVANVSGGDSLGQWLNFKLFGITYLVGKIEFKLFFPGPIG